MRDRIREWLGLNALPTKNQLAALEKADRERHAELMAALEKLDGHVVEVRDTLPRIEQLFQNKHVDRKPLPSVAYDWEQVQIQELAEMLANPPKEEN